MSSKIEELIYKLVLQYKNALISYTGKLSLAPIISLRFQAARKWRHIPVP